LIKEFLRDTNISVIEAENGRQAISLAQKHKPDIIFMDIRMPVMNGWEAIANIRKDSSLQNTPIIALTASGMKKDKIKIIENGFNEFLMKPIQIAHLFKKLMVFLNYSKKKITAHHPKNHGSDLQREKLSPGILTKLPEIINELENK